MYVRDKSCEVIVWYEYIEWYEYIYVSSCYVSSSANDYDVCVKSTECIYAIIIQFLTLFSVVCCSCKYQKPEYLYTRMNYVYYAIVCYRMN